MTGDNVVHIENHISAFKPEWWTPRRRRDYYVDEAGRVKLQPGSETAKQLRLHLIEIANNVRN